MGNSSSIDLPAARVLNRDAFVVAIDRFSEEYCNTATGLFAKATDAHALFESPGIHVAVRKRPLWPSESERGEFDVVRPSMLCPITAAGRFVYWSGTAAQQRLQQLIGMTKEAERHADTSAFYAAAESVTGPDET